jgi:hypothetical protein
MIRVVRLDLHSSLSTSERLDAAFARAKALDDGSSSEVTATVEFALRPDGSVLVRLDRADLFIHDQSTAALAPDDLTSLRTWMQCNQEAVMRWRGSVRRKPLNPGETRWSETTTTKGVSDRPRMVVVDGKEVELPAGTPVSRRTTRWGRAQGVLPPSEPDGPSA